MQRKQSKLLWDLVDSGRAVESYISGMEFEAFKKDAKTQDAVERRLEIIGEVLRRLREIDEDLLASKLPDYYKIIGLRNLIAHGYDKIQISSIWDHVNNHLPLLVEKSEAWLNQ